MMGNGQQVNSKRWIMRRAGWLLCMAALLCLIPSTGAMAAPDKPSKAHHLEIGVAYSSSIPDEDRNDAGHHWLRLPDSMNPGDEITFAIDTDSEIRLCLVPDVDDFGQLDVEEGCDVHGYTSDYEHIDLGAGKYRRTMKWTENSGPGFMLVVGDYDCCRRVTTVYSLLIENVARYEPDLSAPPLITPGHKLKLRRGPRLVVRIFCPEAEVSAPCAGRLLLMTDRKMKFRRGRKRRIVFGRTQFSADSGQMAKIALRLRKPQLRAVRHRRGARKLRLIVWISDQADNEARRARRMVIRL